MDLDNRTDFLKLAGLVEGGTLTAAMLLGWLLRIDPWEHVRFTLEVTVIGLAATLPIFLVYGLAYETRSVAVEMMGLPLSRCRWYDLIILAALAGLGEELLFRGVLQPWLSRSSPLFGLLAANILFGLVHMVTPVYALLATGIGLYLSAVAYAIPQSNLLAAMIAHGVYDYVAFLLIVREYRTRSADTETGDNQFSGDETPPEHPGESPGPAGADD